METPLDGSAPTVENDIAGPTPGQENENGTEAVGKSNQGIQQSAWAALTMSRTYDLTMLLKKVADMDITALRLRFVTMIIRRNILMTNTEQRWVQILDCGKYTSRKLPSQTTTIPATILVPWTAS